MQEVRWLWEKRIPLGKITILDGDPGMGKSLLAIAIAACVSTGCAMPDGTPVQQGGVILIAPEDDAGDTLSPQLPDTGGNPSHVLLLNTVVSLDAKKRQVIDRPFSLSRDLEQLEEAIKRTNALLVVLDPLMAVLGHNVDSSRDQDIRAVFTLLSQLAHIVANIPPSTQLNPSTQCRGRFIVPTPDLSGRPGRVPVLVASAKQPLQVIHRIH